MSVAAIDTLALARMLKEKAHFTPEQAEGVAEAINGVMADQLVTKRDLADLRRDMSDMEARLRAELHSEIGALRAEVHSEGASLRADMELLKRDLTIRLGSMMVVAVGMVTAMVKLL